VVGTVAATSEGTEPAVKLVGVQQPVDLLEDAQNHIKLETELDGWYLDPVSPQPGNTFYVSQLGKNHKGEV
jgi:hypothetical protein